MRAECAVYAVMSNDETKRLAKPHPQLNINIWIFSNEFLIPSFVYFLFGKKEKKKEDISEGRQNCTACGEECLVSKVTQKR